MNTKRLFSIVTILLLAMVMTAWAARAQEIPAAPAKAAPDAVERGESGFPAANLSESEPNNNFARADPLAVGDVVAGVIGSGSDRDYYRVDITGWTTAVLIDIDAQVSGSPLDARICLYDVTLAEVACNDDADGYDSLLFAALGPEACWPCSPYYVSVQDVDYPDEGGPAYTYHLSIYRPDLVSATTDGTVVGVTFTRADVLAHHDFADGTEKWMMFFDASDVGISGNVVALATKYNFEDIALVVQSPQTLPINGNPQTVTPFDVLYFVAAPDGQFGPKTAGEFYIGYAGANYGLSKQGEKIDALTLPFYVSTTGPATFTDGQAARDEDVSNLPYGFMDFDGSRIAGLGAEDVTAADDGTFAGTWGVALTIQGTGRVGGLRVTQKDICFVPWGTTDVTGIIWRGPDHGFNYDIDAFDIID